ncbi:hypothetical protein ABZT06_49670 [Streptomyces sp. NPDC005483]
MPAFRKFMLGLTVGLVVWAATAPIPIIGPWAPVLGLFAAIFLWV